MKDELGGKIMKDSVGLRAKTYRYLTDDNDENNKVKKVQKKCAIKRKLKYEGYKHCLEAAQLENKINHLEKSNIRVDNPLENHKEFIKKQ